MCNLPCTPHSQTYQVLCTEYLRVSRNGASSPGLTAMLQYLTECKEFDRDAIFLQQSILMGRLLEALV